MNNRSWVNVLLAMALATATPAAQAINFGELVFVGAVALIGAQTGREAAKNMVLADSSERTDLFNELKQTQKDVWEWEQRALNLQQRRAQGQGLIPLEDGSTLPITQFIHECDENIRQGAQIVAGLKVKLAVLDRSLFADNAQRLQDISLIGAGIGVLAGACMVHSSHVEAARDEHNNCQLKTFVSQQNRLLLAHQKCSQLVQEQWVSDVEAFADLHKINLAEHTDSKGVLTQAFVQSVGAWIDRGRPE